ncbi:MAG: RDD family protein [Candidatus Bathyarchaeia archaeon]
MSTGFERIGRDSRLQDHWIRRLVAFIIDSIILAIGTLIIAAIVAMPFIIMAAATGLPWFVFNPFTFPFFAGVLSVLYFALLESYYGWTFGKRIMNLKTIDLGGQKPPLDVAFIRNISKIYWILVLMDVVIGLATPGDPHQKVSDRMAGTTVVSTTTPPSSPTPPTSQKALKESKLHESFN